jgi:hypothetical protein
MKLRQSDAYSPVFDVIIGQIPDSGTKVLNANSYRGEVVRRVVSDIQQRSFESCQKKQREKEEKIREFQNQCNKEYEEFQKKVNRDRDILLTHILTISKNLPDSKQQAVNGTERTIRVSDSEQRPVAGNDNDRVLFESSNNRWPVNQQSAELMRAADSSVLSRHQPDLDDMEMVYGNEDLGHSGPAFDASDDSNSSNESIGRSRRRERAIGADIAQSAPVKVPAFHRRKSSDDDDNVRDEGRQFDFHRMTLEASSLSRFTNKSVVSDGTELFGPVPDSGSNPPL